MFVDDYVQSAEVEAAFGGWKPGKVRLVFSDPKSNFRYDIYPDYKVNRKGRERTPEFTALKEWALDKYEWYDHCEADDIVAYLVRKKNAVGFSADKDLLYGVPGLWYDMYHKCWHTTSDEDAKRFVAMQTLAGDPTDNIKGIRGVALKTAEKLLEGDYSWDNIVRIYKEKGYTEADAILTRRLIDMTQVKLKKDGKCKIKLFHS